MTVAGLAALAVSGSASGRVAVTPSPVPAEPRADRIERLAREIVREDDDGAGPLAWRASESGASEIRIAIAGAAGADPAGAQALATLRLGAGWRASLQESDAARATILLDTGDGGPALRLGWLRVTDARGTPVAARLKLAVGAEGEGDLLTIVAESEGAAFPLLAILSLAPDPGVGREKEGAGGTSPIDSLRTADAESAESAPPPANGGFSAERTGTSAEDAPFVVPANDDCTGAIVIPNGSFPVLTAPVDVMDATITGDPVLCVTTDRTIWYTFTAPATGSYTLTTCSSGGAIGTTMPDTVLALLSSAGGCAAPGPGIMCSDDDPACATGGLSTIVANLTGGQTYVIIAGRYAGVGQIPPSAGATSIQILITRAPVNDACAGALPALALDIPVNGTTLAASDDYHLATSAPTCYEKPAPPAPVGQTVSAAAGRDVLYKFTAPATGAYSFRVTNYSPSQNAVLYVSTECPAGAPPVTVGETACGGASNRAITSGPTAEEVMCVPMSAGQTEYVFVDDAVMGNAGSGFRLEVNRCAREAEPNNTPAAANSPSCPVEGSITPQGEADFFTLGAPAAGARVFAMSDGVAANNNDQILRVTTAVDTLEFDDDDNAPAYGGLSPNVAGTPLTGVAAYLRMSPLPSSTLPEEPYRLYAVIQPPLGSATAETEPNNTPAAANASGTNYFSGALAGPAPSTDADVYRFNARAGALIMLNLDGDPLRNNTPIDPKLELIDASGLVLVSVNNSGSTSSTTSGAGTLTSVTPFSPAEALTYRTSVTGTYYARVSIGTTSTASIGAGDYLLSISLDCASGDLDADGVADAKDCAPTDPAKWSIPSEALQLVLSGSGPTALSWSPPAEAGGTAGVIYDVMRGASRSDFSAATCIQSDISVTTATDVGSPPAPGSSWFYLVRSQNSCGGNLGSTSAGVPRTGRNCP